MATKKKSLLQDLEDLGCGRIDAKPRLTLWANIEYGDVDDGAWEAWAAEACEDCSEVLILRVNDGNERHRHIDPMSTCDGHVALFEGPMMNFFYPLGDVLTFTNVEAMAKEIVDLPLCLVRLGDELGLALTGGGGMDLSWEICEAYMRLGYLPPTHFELPDMAGRGLSAKDVWIISGYISACKIHSGWLGRRVDKARSLGRGSDGKKPATKGAGSKTRGK